MAANLRGLGDVAHALGEYGEARQSYERSLKIFEETGRNHDAMVVNEKLAGIQSDKKDVEP